MDSDKFPSADMQTWYCNSRFLWLLYYQIIWKFNFRIFQNFEFISFTILLYLHFDTPKKKIKFLIPIITAID